MLQLGVLHYPQESSKPSFSLPSWRAPRPPILASLYRQCLAEGARLHSMSHTHIVLIYKLPKDLTLCASYRLIALRNNDLKILSKLLTLRLNRLLPSIDESDQTRVYGP